MVDEKTAAIFYCFNDPSGFLLWKSRATKATAVDRAARQEI
jgi:hypothetical protein